MASYTNSSNSYFKQLPRLDYPSLANDRTSVYDYQIVKNFFKRAVLRNDILNDTVSFEKYTVQGDERPDQIAYDFYNDSGLDWVILTTNNIIHVRDEWPMGNQDFLTYINGKYTAQELTNIHHYETLSLRDSLGNIIQKPGFYVGANHSITFLDQGTYRTESKIKQVTFLEHESNVNDKKREINLLRPTLLDEFLRDMDEIMTYKRSDQFISEDLKKTENPRIISP
tara:strand:+ start:2007 stop:2684 length:678 start_codon:yes stop_codon:yes gene_type:complete